MADTTDDLVREDPGAFTVEEVTDAFSRSSSEEVEATKALERAGKNRKGITNWEPPAPEPVDEEPRYERGRVLDPAEGPRIVGEPYHVIVGALDGDNSEDFTRSEVQAKVSAFRGRTVHTEEA